MAMTVLLRPSFSFPNPTPLLIFLSDGLSLGGCIVPSEALQLVRNQKRNKRLDELCVERFKKYSRRLIQSWIIQGKVFVDGKKVDKAGALISDNAVVEIKAEVPKYVCRAEYKLEPAIEQLGVDVAVKVVLDSGLSTGGFTDCLLQHGESFVYGVDACYGQVGRDRIVRDPEVHREATVMNFSMPSVMRCPPRRVTDSSWAPGNEITFTKADLLPYLPSLNSALYLTMELRGVLLSRVLVDNATPFNVMSRRTFDILGYNQNDLLPCSEETADGTVWANLKLGMLDSEVRFVVTDVPAWASCNLLLGIPWLHALRAVPSTVHHKVKLPFKMGNQDGILTIEGER